MDEFTKAALVKQANEAESIDDLRRVLLDLLAAIPTDYVGD